MVVSWYLQRGLQVALVVVGKLAVSTLAEVGGERVSKLLVSAVDETDGPVDLDLGLLLTGPHLDGGASTRATGGPNLSVAALIRGLVETEEDGPELLEGGDTGVDVLTLECATKGVQVDDLVEGVGLGADVVLDAGGGGVDAVDGHELDTGAGLDGEGVEVLLGEGNGGVKGTVLFGVAGNGSLEGDLVEGLAGLEPLEHGNEVDLGHGGRDQIEGDPGLDTGGVLGDSGDELGVVLGLDEEVVADGVEALEAQAGDSVHLALEEAADLILAERVLVVGLLEAGRTDSETHQALRLGLLLPVDAVLDGRAVKDGTGDELIGLADDGARTQGVGDEAAVPGEMGSLLLLGVARASEQLSHGVSGSIPPELLVLVGELEGTSRLLEDLWVGDHLSRRYRRCRRRCRCRYLAWSASCECAEEEGCHAKLHASEECRTS